MTRVPANSWGFTGIPFPFCIVALGSTGELIPFVLFTPGPDLFLAATGFVPGCPSIAADAASATLRLPRLPWQVLQLVKVAKVVYIIQLPYIMKKIEDTVGWSTTKLIFIITCAYFLLHGTACVFYLTSRPFAGNSWVERAVRCRRPLPPLLLIINTFPQPRT